MLKRKSEEVNYGQEPTTSHNIENTNDSNSKKPCFDYNFWEEIDENEGASNMTEEIKLCKINELHIGNYDKHQLNFRVTYKSHVKTTPYGRVINLHGIDKTGEIAIVSYGDNCDSISRLLKINCLYCITHFSVNEENVKFRSGTGNNLKIKLNSNGEIQEIEDEHIPQICFKFLTLRDVQNLNKNEKIDVIGVLVKNFGLSKSYKGDIIRELALTDATKTMLTITLWGIDAENFSSPQFSVLIIRKASVTEFEGKKKLNCLSGTLIWTNPDLPEAVLLKEEFQKLSKTINS